MTIREATPQDLEELYRLWCELMEMHQAYHPIFGFHRAAKGELKRLLRDRLYESYTRIFVAEKPGGLAGLLVATYQIGSRGMHFHRRGYLAETIVEAAHRRQGVGRALFNSAKAWLTVQGADHLELQVALANPAAQQFWAAQGFATTTQHMILPLIDL
ncbi:GNAT family N-acetyltransferase [Hymenobacter tibetensis]|jgi:GNAT superfamily N-acetyltransferase|uniref:GNAT family N-acetyltransferase n=1 Tax=Hymenobacter tibetensis TaxID=497967 RepID=A0ABY4CUQ7_9BACT|nr:GNAT family N-acetyltransferase [Hymenobacter tibetensis]UOG73772.1 GNAT family N-acetyltransferase [Hymenobacter tibetensis]